MLCGTWWVQQKYTYHSDSGQRCALSNHQIRWHLTKRLLHLRVRRNTIGKFGAERNKNKIATDQVSLPHSAVFEYDARVFLYYIYAYTQWISISSGDGSNCDGSTRNCFFLYFHCVRRETNSCRELWPHVRARYLTTIKLYVCTTSFRICWFSFFFFVSFLELAKI